VHQDVPEYAWLIAQGDYDRALEVILARNPLPGVTGHVCTHLCQSRCTRNNYDAPVAIRDLKRFANEHGKVKMPPPVNGNHKVAIVGGGPAGLAAAYFLARNGVRATIFEAREMAGGMLAIAPYFRLPPEVVQRDIDRIANLGVEIKLNHRVSQPPEELLKQGYDAVYLACGFQKDAVLDIEGMESQGVLTALRFLESVARGEQPELGSDVLVIGGGNTAMDAARTAQRLTGRPTTVVYRRTQVESPAEPEELRDLFDEGNRLLELVSPARVLVDDGQVVGLECIRNKLGEPGVDGRRRPVPVAGSEFRIDASSIILAIGQKPDTAFLERSDISFRPNGAIVTDEGTRRAGEAVYAGGDVTRGPAIIIEACEDGRRAAEAICSELGIGFTTPRSHPAELDAADILAVQAERTRKVPKVEPDLLPVDQRSGFGLVEQTLSEQMAHTEAARCLQCSVICDKCIEVCPNRANFHYSAVPVSWTLPVLTSENGGLAVVGREEFRVTQSRQIVHIDDFCNECGNCATFCVHQGKPYADKPRLFLKEQDYLLEQDNAFLIEDNTIRRREGGQESRLTLDEGGMIFDNGHMRLQLTSGWEIQEMVLKKGFEGTYSLRVASEMMVLWQGITTSASFLKIGALQ
jgi:putative selenate reductase